MSATLWLASDQVQDQLLLKGSRVAELWVQRAAPCFQKDFALRSNDAFVCPEQVQHWLQDMCTCRDEPALANLCGLFEHFSLKVICQWQPLLSIAQNFAPRLVAGRRVYFLLVETKFSIIMEAAGVDEFVHWDSHAADPSYPDWSLSIVACEPSSLLDMMVLRQTYDKQNVASL